MMKKLLILALAVGMLLGCLTNFALAEEEQVVRFAYCAPDQNDSQLVYTNLMHAYIDQINAEHRGYQIEFQVFNANFDLATQIVQVESLIVNGCDVMLIFPNDTEGALSIIQQARDAGIKVIDATGNVNFADAVDCVYVSSGEEKVADLLDEWIQKNYDATGEKLKAGVIYGSMNQIPQLPRGDRRFDYAEAHPEQCEILVSGSGEWDTQTAMSLTEDWLVSQPELNTLFVANTDMAQGVAQALHSSGKNLDEYLVTTVDLTYVALDMLKAGDVDVICGCDKWDEARAAVDLCMNVYFGTYTEPVYYLPEFWCIDNTNYNEYIEYSADWNEMLQNYTA